MGELPNLLSVNLVEFASTRISVGIVLKVTATLLLTLLASRLGARVVERTLARRGQPEGVQYAFGRVTRYGIAFVGVLVAISTTGVNLTAVFAASTVVLVGVGLGLQSIAQNFVSGVILLLEQPVRKGDFIRVGASVGTVRNIGLRSTEVVTRDEVTIVVPNSDLVNLAVINHSKPTRNMRILVPVGVHYRSDPAVVRRTLLAVAQASKAVLKDPAPEVRFDGFGDSSLDFVLLVWVEDPRDDLRVASELRYGLYAALAEQGIEIPYPQRVVHLPPAPAKA